MHSTNLIYLHSVYQQSRLVSLHEATDLGVQIVALETPNFEHLPIMKEFYHQLRNQFLLLENQSPLQHVNVNESAFLKPYSLCQKKHPEVNERQSVLQLVSSHRSDQQLLQLAPNPFCHFQKHALKIHLLSLQSHLIQANVLTVRFESQDHHALEVLQHLHL